METEKKKKNYNMLNATIWYTICNLITKGVAFFVLPIFTKLMTPDEYGVYTIYLSYLATHKPFDI